MLSLPPHLRRRAEVVAEYRTMADQGHRVTDIEATLAEKYDISERTVRRYRTSDCATEAVTSGDFEIVLPDSGGGFVKGTSTLFDADGKVKLKWVREENKYDKEVFREWVDEIAQDLPHLTPTPATEEYDDLLTVIPFGDVHLGLHAWRMEAGDDFDLNIATTDLCAAVDRLVKCTPSSKECLIVNCGDYFHADNNNSETSRGHNKLDTDTRWSKVLVAGLKAMRQCIASALEHHEKVTVINAIGNHDDHSSIFLTVALANIYENEPRVHIIDNPTIVHYYDFGNNLIGVHHGHTIKPEQLPLIMAIDRPQEWARCNNRMWITGHLHKTIKREYQGVVVETFRTLAARDAWAASMGYVSGRDMNAIIFHREFGEVARHIVSVDMLRSVQNNDKIN